MRWPGQAGWGGRCGAGRLWCRFVWPPRCGGAYGSRFGAGQVPVGGGADPQQDAWPEVDEGPPAGAFGAVVVAAQGGEVARAGGSTEMVGHSDVTRPRQGVGGAEAHIPRLRNMQCSVS